MIYAVKIVQDYNNPLTRSIADDIYCIRDSECNLTVLNVENTTITNSNITGNIDISGYIRKNGEDINSTSELSIFFEKNILISLERMLTRILISPLII